MANSTEANQLSRVIGQELTRYHAEVVKAVNDAGADAAKALVQKTRKNAPKSSGKYSNAIGVSVETAPITGENTYIWGAKGKKGSLTHLLANGHRTRNGGRSKSDDFLRNAVNEVIPEYEKTVKQTIERGLME